MCMRHTYHLLLVLALALSMAPLGARAAPSSGLVDGLWLSSDPVLDSRETTVYAVLHNQTEAVIEGLATLVVDGSAVQAQEVRVTAGDIKRIGMKQQFTTGLHTVAITFTPHNGVEVATRELARKTVVVLRDTDADGVPDKDDTDDDNDGVLDTEDPHPLEALETPQKQANSTRALLGKLVGNSVVKTQAEQETGTHATTSSNTSGDTATMQSAFAALEAFRKESAASLAEYEAERRAALAEITKRHERASNVEGFEPSIKERSDKREEQIAAASAATLGFMLDKKFVFYAEIVVLSLGVLHLLWIWIKSLLRTKEVEDEWEE